jgi:hypothetical protein
MKLAFFDDFKLGVIAGDSVVDVTNVVKDISRLGPQDVMRGVIERFDALKGQLADAAAKGQGKPVSQVRFRLPLKQAMTTTSPLVGIKPSPSRPGAVMWWSPRYCPGWCGVPRCEQTSSRSVAAIGHAI